MNFANFTLLTFTDFHLIITTQERIVFSIFWRESTATDCFVCLSVHPIALTASSLVVFAHIEIINISEYPSIPPDLRIKNPRGLDDAAVAGLVKQMKTR